MRSDFIYVLTQAGRTLRRYPLMLISIGLALSLVTSINIYIYNSKVYTLQQYKYSFGDFYITTQYQAELEPHNCTDIFSQYYSDFVNITTNTFPIRDYFPLIIMKNQDFRLEVITAESDKFTTDQIQWVLSDANFYHSNDFEREYSLYSGHLPETKNEVVVDLVSAVKLGIFENISSDAQISIQNASNPSQNLASISRSNWLFEVVGVVIPNNNFCDFLGDHDPRIKMTYSSENIQNADTARFQSWYSCLFFGLLDVNNLTHHPVLEMLETLTIPAINSNWEITSGVTFLYDRSTISPNSLGKTAKVIQQIFYNEYSDLISGNVSLYAEIVWILQDIEQNSRILFVMQILIIPLLICLIFVSTMMVTTAYQSRIQDIQLSLIKGYPKKLIFSQFWVEMITAGFIVGLLSIAFGWIFYLGIQSVLNPTLEQITMTSYDEISITRIRVSIPSEPLPYFINFGNWVAALMIGVLVFIIIYLKLINTLKKTPLHEISDIISQANLETVIDEKIFTHQPVRKKRGQKKPKANSDTPELYITQNDLYNKKKRQYGIIFVCFGLVPLLLTFLMQMGIESKLDFIVFISYSLFRYSSILVILNFLSPILLVFGFLQIVMIEHSIIYSRLIASFSSIFIGEKSIINAIESLRYKNLKVLSMLMAMIVSMFIFTNISIYSQQNLKPAVYNFQIGTELNVHTINNYEAIDEYTKMISPKDLLEFQNCAENISVAETNEWNPKAVPMISLCDLSQGNWRGFQSLILTNISRYMEIAQRPYILQSNPDFYLKLRSIIEFNEENPNIRAILASQEFLNTYGFSVGDSFYLNPDKFPFTANFSNQDLIQVKIVDKVVWFPGYYNSIYEVYPFLMDWEILGLENTWMNNSELEITYGTLNLLVGGDIFLEEGWNIPLTEIYSSFPSKYQEILYISLYDFDFGKTGIFTFSDYEGDDLSFFLLYFEILLLLLFLGLSIIFLVNLYQKANQGYYGSLLIQGFGLKDLHRMVLSQLLFTIGFTIVIGTVIGAITGISWTLSLLGNELQNSDLYGLQIPLTFNFIEYFIVLAALVIGSFLGFLGVKWNYHKKEYSSFLIQSS